VSVVECANIRTGKSFNNPYVILSVNQVSRYTNVGEPINPLFNENFTFEIINGCEELKIIIVD
jgi:hypothetical protein